MQDAKTPEERRTLRSKTFAGIAKAMATQWTNYVLNSGQENFNKSFEPKTLFDAES